MNKSKEEKAKDTSVSPLPGVGVPTREALPQRPIAVLTREDLLNMSLPLPPEVYETLKRLAYEDVHAFFKLTGGKELASLQYYVLDTMAHEE